MSADPSTSRIAALDVLRGLAIFGTFAANVWLFASTAGPAVVLFGGDGAGAEAVLRALVNGKFLALLTLLFGVGMELQYRAAVRRGLRWPGRYLLRATLLLVEGLLHYVLVFEFDVLMGYAIASMIVAYLIGRSARTQAVAATVAGGVLVLLVAAITAGGGTTGGPTPPYPPDWAGQVGVRLTQWPLYRIELLLIVPLAVLLFLTGARLARAGAFAATAEGARIRRVLLVLGVAGVALNTAGSLAGPSLFAVDRYLTAPLVACGLAAVGTAAVHAWRAGPVRRGLTVVGRTAMSCYVGQNLVAGIVFHPWGLDLAARLDGVAGGTRVTVVVGVWALVCAGSVLAAAVWLRRFDRGPLELAMHAVLRAGSRPVPVTRR